MYKDFLFSNIAKYNKTRVVYACKSIMLKSLSVMRNMAIGQQFFFLLRNDDIFLNLLLF